MDNDLERSVRLLEDALSTPTKGLFKIQPASHRTPETSTLFTDSFIKKPNDISLLLENNKSITGSIIQSGLPWESTLNNLYGEFATIVQNSIAGSDILEITADLARCCSDALTVIQGLKSKVAIRHEITEEKWLENERNNWRLLFVLYQDRLQYQNDEMKEFEQYIGVSEKNCIDALFRRDHLIRESQLVIDWLERNALEKDDPILHHSDWTYGWENTLHQLLAPDSIAIGSNTKTIQSIHPDACLVEGLPLHHLDEDNEKKLSHRIFAEIRCGKLQEAQELCISCGHPWRAVMLEGWKLYHNPNTKDEDYYIREDDITDNDNDNSIMRQTNGRSEVNLPFKEQELLPIEGNRGRDLWKLMAIEYSKHEKLDFYDRATIASLCGCLDSILPVCHSWEDYLWAYMKTMVDIRVESEIRDSIVREYKKLPDDYWEQKMSLNEIFERLESSSNDRVREESEEPDHIIQKLIILDEIKKLIELLNEWSEKDEVSTHSLRFYTHLILFFDHVGELTNRKVCERIIERYIARLSDMNETELLAFYVSKLGKKKQVPIYSNHLEKIIDNELRQAALSYGEAHGIDVLSVTKRIVECIRNRPTTLSNELFVNKISDEDYEKISALDWLIFYEEQRAEALAQCNALLFTFLTLRKIDAAHTAIDKIPQDSVEKIRAEGEVSEEIDQIIKEYLSYKTYLDTHEAFNEWFRQFNSKPLPPVKPSDNVPFTEKVAYEHKVTQHKAEVERWKLSTSQSAKTAKTLMYNVLLFPGGWLVGGDDADYLRSICIPEVVMLLYSVLNESGEHEEAVQLADLLASEKNGLYKVYSKEKLAEILEKICESSVILLNSKKDPWGCPVTA